MIDSAPLFFIVCRGRSGSTLLQNLLDAHTAILAPPESPFIYDLYKHFGHINWQPADVKQFVQTLRKRPDLTAWQLNHISLQQQLLATLPNLTYAKACKAVFQNYQSIYSKKSITLLGNKLPKTNRHVPRIHLLKTLFPEARFIYLVREFKDNYTSMAKRRMGKRIIPLQAMDWLAMDNAFGQLTKSYPSDTITIRYEDLVSAPENALMRICQFLGTTFQPQQLSFHIKLNAMSGKLKHTQFYQYHSNLPHPVTRKHINSWKGYLSPQQIKIADCAIGRVAEKHGYTRQHTTYSMGIRLYTGIMTFIAHLFLSGRNVWYRFRIR